MKTPNIFLALIFSPGQLAVVIILAVLLAAAIALNLFFAVRFRIKQERRLYDDSLQSRREALLDKLHYLNSGGEVESHSWLNFVEADDEEDEDEDGRKFVNVRIEVGQRPEGAELLSVDAMDPRVKRKLGFRAKRFVGKKYYVRYLLGFEARLRYSDDETKVRYMELMDEIKSYENVSVVKSFSGLKICYGKDLIAMILFGGKRMCIAFALNPAEYENAKYRGEDKSDKRRFAKTPMLVRLGSDEKLKAAFHLFAVLAEKNGFVKGKPRKGKYDLSERTREDLIATGSVRVIILDEAHGVEEPTPAEENAPAPEMEQPTPEDIDVDETSDSEAAAAAAEEEEETLTEEPKVEQE